MRLWFRSFATLVVLLLPILLTSPPLQLSAQTNEASSGWVYDDYGCAFYQENGAFTGLIDCPRPANEGWAPGCYQFLDGPHYWDGSSLSGLGCPVTDTADPTEPSVDNNSQDDSSESSEERDNAIPANGCDQELSDPAYACPVVPLASYPYIEHVQAVAGGIVIQLTPDGIAHGRTCGGAADIARMTEDLYYRVPETNREADPIDWGARQLEDEIYAHAVFASFPEGVAPFGIELSKNGNPINIDFADYTNLSQRSEVHRSQQAAFWTMGNVKRATCNLQLGPSDSDFIQGGYHLWQSQSWTL